MLENIELFEALNNPYALIAFTLSLVFLLVKYAQTRERKWILPLFLCLSFVVVGGSLYTLSNSPSSAPPPERKLEASTTGDKSPVIGVVHGTVNFGE